MYIVEIEMDIVCERNVGARSPVHKSCIHHRIFAYYIHLYLPHCVCICTLPSGKQT